MTIFRKTLYGEEAKQLRTRLEAANSGKDMPYAFVGFPVADGTRYLLPSPMRLTVRDVEGRTVVDMEWKIQMTPDAIFKMKGIRFEINKNDALGKAGRIALRLYDDVTNEYIGLIAAWEQSDQNGRMKVNLLTGIDDDMQVVLGLKRIGRMD